MGPYTYVTIMTRDEPQELAAAQQAAEAFAEGAITFDHAASVEEAETPPRELADQPATVVTSLRTWSCSPPSGDVHELCQSLHKRRHRTHPCPRSVGSWSRR
jgi:hypothetical protein